MVDGAHLGTGERAAVSPASLPSASGRTASCSAMVGTSIVHLTSCSAIALSARSGCHESMLTIVPPSMAGRYMPKQNAATEDSGTKAPTASPGRSPIASIVE